MEQIRCFLTALPCLRAVTDLLVQFSEKYLQQDWNHKLPVPEPLQGQVKEIGLLSKGMARLSPQVFQSFEWQQCRLQKTLG